MIQHEQLAALLQLALLCSLATGQQAPLFEKDHMMDTVFPPVTWQHPELPAGHLRALGFQRPPEGPLQTIKRQLSPLEFVSDFVLRQKPLVVREAMDKDCPAMKLWTDKELSRRFGQQLVKVTHKKETMEGTVGLMEYSKFLSLYRMQDLYMSELVPKEMDSGFWLPRFAACGAVPRSASEASMWMAAGGTGSLLHYHAQHLLYCVADGRKDFIVIRPEFKDKLRCVESPSGSGNGRSQLDADMINGFEDPQVAEVEWRYATLLPGDCLYLPPGHLHQVRGYGRNFAFGVAFRPAKGDKDFSDCTRNPTPTSLAELPLKWTVENGRTRLRNRKLDAEALRSLLLDEVPDAGFLTFASFKHFYLRALDGSRVAERGLQPKSAFRLLLRSDKKQVLTADSVRKIPQQELEQVARFLNSVHRQIRDEL